MNATHRASRLYAASRSMNNKQINQLSGPSFAFTGRPWNPDSITLDDRFVEVAALALRDVGQPYELTRWVKEQADAAEIQRWYDGQHRALRALVLDQIGSAHMKPTFGHPTHIDDESTSWTVRTIVVNRTRAVSAVAS